MVRMWTYALTGFVLVAIGVTALGAPDAHAATRRVQDIIGEYQQKSPYCAKGSRIVGSIVPCSRHCDNPDTPQDESAPCTLCHFIVLGHNIVRYITYIAVFVAFLMITFAGVVYVISAGDQGLLATAKGAFRNGLIGLAIVLVAWVVINTIITVFLKPNADALQGNWWSYYCSSTATGGAAGAGGETTGGGTTVAGTGAGGAQGGGAGAAPADPATGRIRDLYTYPGTVAYCNTGPDPSSPGRYIAIATQCYTAEHAEICRNQFGARCRRVDRVAGTQLQWHSSGYYDELRLAGPDGAPVQVRVRKPNGEIINQELVGESVPIDPNSPDPLQAAQATCQQRRADLIKSMEDLVVPEDRGKLELMQCRGFFK